MYIREETDVSDGMAAGPPHWKMLRDRVPVDFTEAVFLSFNDETYDEQESVDESKSRMVVHVHQEFLKYPQKRRRD